MPEVKKFHDKQTKEHFKGRSLGVTWNNLTVKGISSDAAIHENVLSQFNIPQIVREKRRGSPKKTILDNVHGCVKPGEMLLVLGRPGSGCSSLLKILANHREGYAEVNGEVNFGSMVSLQPPSKGAFELLRSTVPQTRPTLAGQLAKQSILCAERAILLIPCDRTTKKLTNIEAKS